MCKKNAEVVCKKQAGKDFWKSRDSGSDCDGHVCKEWNTSPIFERISKHAIGNYQTERKLYIHSKSAVNSITWAYARAYARVLVLCGIVCGFMILYTSVEILIKKRV